MKDLRAHGDEGESLSQGRFHVELVKTGHQDMGDEEDEREVEDGCGVVMVAVV